jgi:predicted RecB family nuclease
MRALLHCRYKAWQLAAGKRDDIAWTVDESVLHIYLPAATPSAQDKIAAVAWYYGQEGREMRTITKLILHGASQTVTVKVTQEQAKARKLLEEVRTILNGSPPPPFYRNPHCPECPWRETCMEKIRERDCISLLGGMSPGVLAKFHKKGIFSILQLSDLFRPRRRGRVLPKPGRYPWELKALAIREQKTYLLHKPELGGLGVEGGRMNDAGADGPGVAIYLDMEGLPDENFTWSAGSSCSKGSRTSLFHFGRIVHRRRGIFSWTCGKS